MVQLKEVSIHLSIKKNLFTRNYLFLTECIIMYLKVPQNSKVHRILKGKGQGLCKAIPGLSLAIPGLSLLVPSQFKDVPYSSCLIFLSAISKH